MQKLVKHLLRKGGIDGPLVGIEIEVEGQNLPTQVKGWNCTHDGSLRGENVEYVLAKPSTREEAVTCLKQLNLAFMRKSPVVADTGYAGIHVHINVGDLTWRQLLRFLSFYYVLEPLFIEWSGDNRKDNLFCLPIVAADLPLLHLQAFLRDAAVPALATDDIRYAALNLKALSDYGSVEFRSLRSTLDRKVIISWMDMLLTLREKALEERPLTWIAEALSEQQGGLVSHLLGEELAKELDFVQDPVNKMYESLRKIQTLLYTLPEAAIDKRWTKKESAEPVRPADLQEAAERFFADFRNPHPRQAPRRIADVIVEHANEPDFDF